MSPDDAFMMLVGQIALWSAIGAIAFAALLCLAFNAIKFPEVKSPPPPDNPWKDPR